jgi:acyl-CoA synthetase (AMP-forming)/AMP-acid ligase II
MTCTVPPTTQPRFAVLTEALRAHADERPGASALSGGDEILTYSDVGELVDVLASRFVRLGVNAGDRVAILGTNSPEWVLAFLAALELGAIAVPLNYRLGRLELARQLEQVRPRLILHDAQFAGHLPEQTQGAERKTLGRGDEGHSIWATPRASFESVTAGQHTPALISFTSGSTGVPKGALISHGALVRAANAYAHTLQTGEDDSTLVLVPLFHNTGFCDQLAHMLLVGGACDLLPEFTTAAAQTALTRREASYLIAVPGILRLLAIGEDRDRIFSGCRIACYGGSPMPPAWIEEFAASWPDLRLYNCYGLTEFTSVSHILEPADMAGHAASVGRPVPGVEQLIVDADGKPVEDGVAGELLLSGPTRMLGYWEAPELTEAAFRDHWLRTGDVGVVDEDGFLELVGRASDVINRGGEKISPLQVESALGLEPLIGDAAVIGAPHPKFGERVIAFVTLRGTTELDRDQVARNLRERIADYAVPEQFIVLDELPRNAAGKTNRQELRRCAEEKFEGRVQS